MDHSTTEQGVLFADLFRKPFYVAFDRRRTSSDGGAVLLRAANRRLGLIERLAGSMTDPRQASKVSHELEELLAQRVFAIAAGYPDCNDLGRLSDDPVMRLLVYRDDARNASFGSQSTLSRFENSTSRTNLLRMGTALAEAVIERHRQRLHGRAKRITIDLDPTDTATYGGQQLTFFHGHYDTYCYLPTLAFISFDREPEQFAVAALLRPGNVGAALGARGLLRRLIARVRTAFPKARLLVRLDGGFGSAEMLEFLDAQGVQYVAGLAENSVLKGKSAKLTQQAQRAAEETGTTVKFFGECRYAAQSWKSRRRRIVIKAEVVFAEGRTPKSNTRYVVTNLPYNPERIYRVDYCGRGEVENRIKELKDMRIDRMSCTRFWANQLRLLLTLAAYALMQEIRSRADRTELRRAQVGTLRERLFKIAASVVSSVRRFVLHFPESFAGAQAWKSVAASFALDTA